MLVQRNDVYVTESYVIKWQLPPSSRCRAMNLLCQSQTEAQRLIAKHVNAYPLWTTGETSTLRWANLIEKFTGLYETDISPSARQWRKKRGQCCAHLVGAPKHDGKVRWALLVTADGAGAVKKQERLRDARSERLVWGDYVLIRSTRSNAVGGGTHWSWFLTPEAERREANYLTRLAQIAGCGRQPYQLSAFVNTLLQRPLHAGVRQQVAKMLRRAQKVWAKHSQGLAWPGPDPSDLPHLGAYRKARLPAGEGGI